MNTDVLTLEEDKDFKEIEVSEKNIPLEEEIKYCLNCGTEINDKFCPHCGQSTATPSKLKIKNFGKGVIMSFGRLTPGFYTTAKGLILQPWEVIRDHIHGKHIRYSPPITMIIQVFLYATVIYTFLDAVFGTNLTELYNFEEGLGYKGNNPILKMLDQSVVIQSLFIGIPVCFGIYLGFYRHGARKYNFAEYLAAFTYMYAAINIYDFLLNLVYVIPGIEFDVSNLTSIIAVVFSVIILLKAFPQNKWWKTILLLIWSGFITSILMTLAFVLCYMLLRISEIHKFLNFF